jgi:5-methylcytosine-specific restriction endonuclease McrA
MLKSCSYCGRVHEKAFDCGMKPKQRTGKGYTKERSDIDRLRNTRRWRAKSLEIRKRDKGLCQICIRQLFNTITQYTMQTIEVHHIVPIHENVNRMYDNNNLITVCKYHHNMAEYGDIPRARLHSIAIEQEHKNKLVY